ncbi:alpha/beta fold hydrolase [Nocardia pseudovaccinii]|uniref:alpha/beta fold hydrolase n=1 Tax=Nocardia pseudovaccinii TaxID=189540 RepID=UPI0007A49B16|nr:alpha/beta hydrolase [Nocardia pseudovaccinii]
MSYPYYSDTGPTGAPVVVSVGALGRDARTHPARGSAPALVIAAMQDRVTPPNLVRELVTLLPRTELRLTPNCGHRAQAEQPEAFNALLSAPLANALPAEQRRSALVRPLSFSREGRGTYQKDVHS